MSFMDIIIIVGSVFIAGFAGFLFHFAVSRFKRDEVIVTHKHPLEMIPNYIYYSFAVAIFLFIMANVILITYFKGP